MIFYLTSVANSKGLAYVPLWGPTSGSRMQFLLYDDLLHRKQLPPGTYVFADLERLSARYLQIARQVWNELSSAGSRVCLLNNPARVLRRYELLSKLYEAGVNRFRAIRASDSLELLRFPVFLRREDEHTGSLTCLLHSREELDRALRYVRLQGHPLGNLLVVEFCNTADAAGVFRKYSAFVVGNEILPRHVLFSRNWLVKEPDLVDEKFAQEQLEFLEGNPHAPWLREIFRLAAIDYGRIDYTLLGNDPQVWEINTNPTIKMLTPRLTSAFDAIDCATDGGYPIGITMDPNLVRSVNREARWQRRARSFRRIVPALASTHLLRPISRIVKARLRP
jgi:hypothetical protein